MKESNFPQPTDEQLAGFREGDPIAINEVVELVLPPILRWAWGNYDLLPRDDVQDIVHQVLAEICHQPARYDPSLALFTTYVIRLLRLRMADLYITQREIEEQEEYGPDAYEKLLELPYNDTGTIDEDTRIVREDFFNQLEKHLEPFERELLQLMRKGIKSTKAAAAILSRYGPIADEERDVKNAKARLERKMAFIRKKLGFKLEDLS